MPSWAISSPALHSRPIGFRQLVELRNGLGRTFGGDNQFGGARLFIHMVTARRSGRSPYSHLRGRPP